ncbi:MAG TPA: flagellar basal body protein [Sphingopyxis sp.]|nr:flagellar basal body protein [Sphingopyxis sp.]
MDPISTALISKALDGLHLRAAVIADNIANVNSPGFTPRKVSFEQALRTAAAQGLGAIAGSGAKVEVAPRSGIASDVRLDMEMADAAQTAARYSALVDLLGRQMQIHRTAIRGGQ